GGHQQGPAGPGGHQQGPAGPGGHQQGPVAHHSSEQALAAGSNRVRWRVAVERPMLWWPRALGAQPRHRVEVAVALDGVPSDVRAVDTGLRQVRMRNFIASVNGERIFLKGSNLAPTNRALADATAAQVEGDVHLAIDAGLDLLRVHAHIARPELYEAADREGMLLWQDLPLQWSYKGVRRQAIRQARQAVDLLAHHPSVAIWCGHNEPFSAGVEPGGDVTASAKTRLAAGQILPSWNKTRLDHSIKRSLEKADGSRPVVAHSGVIPHPGGGTDSHFYFGWYHGDERDLPRALARLPTMARWVGEFGAQAVPDSDDFMGPQRWPDLDWDHLGRAHALQKGIFDRRVPPAAHETLGEWRHATQSYQAELIRFHVETLRRLKYHPTGGFCHFLLADAQPAVSWSVLDHLRVPKTGYRALADACAPVIVVADRPAASYRPGERLDIAVHVVSDLRVALGDAVVTAVLRWADGQRTWRFAGDVGADSCSRVGRLEHTWPGDVADGAVDVDLHLDVPERATIASNHYCSEISDTDGTVA
ncbi:MAG TPA: hypothetical protein VG184_01840, partial [Acidimicrobiales bacterium]|nr:hypothetical protein [Acidimicrobiales bacterium]